LREAFTLVSIDRRGHGSSGDSLAPYTITREFEDLATIIDTFDEPVSVFGHSYGALVALGATPLAHNLVKLVLYEPPCGVFNVSDALLERLDELARRGEQEKLMAEFLVDFVGVDAPLLQAERSKADWSVRVAAAATIPRELHSARTWKPNPADYSTVTTPAVLLLGTASSAWERKGTENARALIKNSRVVPLEGQGHIATATAPELLAAKILAAIRQ
jgi:pimeloyl-ACP methyl ester carboxylesterase